MGLRRAEVSPSSLEDPVVSQILGGLYPICVLDLDCLLGIMDSCLDSSAISRLGHL